MECPHCGAYIPDDKLYCGKCGYEVQIVPDYNPLEDVLAKEVKGSIDGYTGPLQAGEGRSRRMTENIRNGEQRRKGTTGEVRKTSTDIRHTGVYTGKITDSEQRRVSAEEKRRQQMARKRQIQKKKKQRRRLIAGVVFLVLILCAVLFYKTSYIGIVRSGEKALENLEYSKAESKFNKAIHKNEKRPEAYTGLAKVYQKQDDLEGAEQVFLTALATQPENADLYEAAIQFYLETDQMKKISELLDGCSSSVLAKVKDYVSEPPEFSLEEGTFDEVQQVSLTSDGEKIYYTINGTNPTTLDKEYTEPILLNEGTNEVRAISVNKKGIPSVVVSRTYVIDIPVADAPAVTPSTGQYDTYTEITIQVPEGYTAYYTMDNTDPTTASNVYTGPIEMPEGQTIFSAVLVNGQGKMTQITKRNYVLEYDE